MSKHRRSQLESQLGVRIVINDAVDQRSYYEYDTERSLGSRPIKAKDAYGNAEWISYPFKLKG